MTATTGSHPATAAPGPVPAAARRRVAGLLLTLLVLAAVGLVVFQWWEPPFTGRVDFDTTAGLGAAYWPMNVLLGGPAFAVTFVVAAVFLAVLGDLRWPALLASTVLASAGIVFALVITAETLPFVWAADPTVLDPATGRSVTDAFNTALPGFGGWIVGSMVAITVAVLVAVIWAAVVGGLPWWVVALSVAVAVAGFVLPAVPSVVIGVALIERAVWVLIGWFGYRRMTRTTGSPAHAG